MKRAVWVPLVGAIVWAALLLPGAVYVPIGRQQYETTAAGTPPAVQSSLVQLNGHGILLLVAVPLVLSCVTGMALMVQGRTGSLVAQWVAWVCTGTVLTGALLGTVTFLIGIFVMPGGAVLSVACVNQHQELAWRRAADSTSGQYHSRHQVIGTDWLA